MRQQAVLEGRTTGAQGRHHAALFLPQMKDLRVCVEFQALHIGFVADRRD